MTTLATAALPPWADELKRRYLAGEAGLFLVHGNVHDAIAHDGKLLPFVEFVHTVVLAAKPQRYELALRHAGLKQYGEKGKTIEPGDTLLANLAYLEARMRASEGLA